MLPKVFYDEDADISVVKDKIVAIIGYGHQGRAQALNMRDSGLNVIVGNIKDESWERAASDGFKVYTIEEAAKRADIIFMLVPDEIQGEIFETSIEKNLKKGATLNFAHGYCINYGLLVPPSDIDVIMIAPRMIGEYVRKLYEAGNGFPSLIAIHQDASGQAKKVTLGLAKALGSTRVGVVESTFAEETEIDLFDEQTAQTAMTVLGWEVLVEEGYPPWLAALEFWGSGEKAESYKAKAEYGFFKAGFETGSRTARYGGMTRGDTLLTKKLREEIKDRMRERLHDIQNGVFAREWAMEKQLNFPVYEKLKKRVLEHPINEAEKTMRALFKKKPLV